MVRLSLSFAVALVCAAAVPVNAAAAWLTPSATEAVREHSAKVPADFARAADAQRTDSLLVLVSVNRRDAGSEALAAGSTLKHQWALATPVFIALVTPAQVADLLDSNRVTFVEPDRPVELKLATSTIDIKARNAMWSFQPGAGVGSLASGFSDLTVDQATGKGVTVAIVDSGLDSSHPDFGRWDCSTSPIATATTPCPSRVRQKIINNPFVNPDHDASAAPTTDFASGHGTHVAGIVAGNGFDRRLNGADTRLGGDGIPIGVAPQADLLSVKGGESKALVSAFQGIDYVAANAKTFGIRAVNNSWGCIGGCPAQAANSATNLAIKKAYDAGVVVTFAAGNDAGTDSGSALSGDSQSPYALSVANYDHATGQLATSSSRGARSAPMFNAETWTPESEIAAAPAGARRPDVAAPGTNIWSTRNSTGGTESLIGAVPLAVNPYVSMTGTSMSAPHVAGAAAVLFSACPAARPLDVMRAIMATANPTRVTKSGSSATAEPFEVGYGALDVRAAHEWMRVKVPACGFEAPNVAPTASITGPESVTATDPATFDASGSRDSDGSIVSYAWDFGDGATGLGATAGHAFARSGSYVVTLTVTDDRGASAVATKLVTVANAAPAAAFDGPASLRHQTPGTFDASGSRDNDGSIVSSTWDFGDGTTGSGATAEHAYTWAGDYVVKLSVTDDEGATATTTRTITVTDVPDSGYKRLNASGLTSHKCSSTAWEFTLKPVASGEAPSSIAVVWADGSRQRVPLSGVKSKVATYRTTQSLGEIATKAWGDVPSASTAALALASGPCQ
jgi:subtilisin family serine protease